MSCFCYSYKVSIYSIISNRKVAGHVAQVVERLPRKHEALSSQTQILLKKVKSKKMKRIYEMDIMFQEQWFFQQY